MPRALLLCTSIVAAFQIRLAAAPTLYEDVVVPRPTLALARTLGMDPERDRSRFTTEIIRLFYSHIDRAATLDAARRDESDDAGAPMRVAVPLSTEAWSRLFKRAVPADQLIDRIVRDRDAALICYALAALDEETLTYLAARPALLERLYERDAAPFAAFGASVKIHAETIVPPGGEAAAPLWESVIRQPVRNPEAFLRALLEENDARTAYLYDTVSALDAPHAAFALGLWMQPALQPARLATLAAANGREYREWRPAETPFIKPLNDLSMALARVRVDPSGTPANPSALAFWERALDTGAGSGAGSIDAAWLVEATASGDMFARGDRIDAFTFGQRLFANVTETDWADAAEVVRAFPRYRMLLLTLERMGVRQPSVYAAVVRQARQKSIDDANKTFWVMAQLQGSLAVLDALVRSRTLRPADAQPLVLSLFAVPADNGRYNGGIAAWLDRELLPRLPKSDTAEDTVIAAIAGPVERTAPHINWEGQDYVLDFAAAERKRLHDVRQKQGGTSIDAPLAISRLVRSLSGRPTHQQLQSAVAQLGALQRELPRDAARGAIAFGPGVALPRPPSETVRRALEELSREANAGDDRRPAHALSLLTDAADVMLSDALLSVSYAMHLGDPSGTALLGSNVALRHDFGFEVRDGESRARRLWGAPRQDFLPGVPWHVTGALVGLDVALAPLALRRINADGIAKAPRVPSLDRDAFATALTLMDRHQLRDTDRDAIANALGRGERRVARLAAGQEAAAAVAADLSLDGWRRNELQWLIARDPASVPVFFSLVETMVLGGGVALSDLDSWGMGAVATSVCLCTRMEPSAHWRLFSGHPQIALIPALVADLNVRVASVLSELHLPAALARAVLAAAMQDFIDEAPATDADDWRGMAHAARAVSRERIEDYVAWAAAVDGPLIPDGPGTRAERGDR